MHGGALRGAASIQGLINVALVARQAQLTQSCTRSGHQQDLWLLVTRHNDCDTSRCRSDVEQL